MESHSKKNKRRESVVFWWEPKPKPKPLKKDRVTGKSQQFKAKPGSGAKLPSTMTRVLKKSAVHGPFISVTVSPLLNSSLLFYPPAPAPAPASTSISISTSAPTSTLLSVSASPAVSEEEAQLVSRIKRMVADKKIEVNSERYHLEILITLLDKLMLECWGFDKFMPGGCEGEVFSPYRFDIDRSANDKLYWWIDTPLRTNKGLSVANLICITLTTINLCPDISKISSTPEGLFLSISGTNADVTAHQPLVDNLIICFERAFRKFLPLQRELDNLAVIDRSCNRLIKEENLQIFKGLLDRLLHQLGTKIALDHRVQYHIEIYQSSSANGADDEKGHNKQFSSIEVTVPKKEEGYKLLNRVVIALNHAKIRHGILKDGPESKELVLRISELEVDKVAREEVDKSANKPVGFMRLLTVFNNAVREPLSEQDSTPEDLQAYIRGEPSSQSNGRGPSFVG